MNSVCRFSTGGLLGPGHRRKLYLYFTIGNSDHSSLSAVILMAQATIKLVCFSTNLCVSWKFFLSHQVNWNKICGLTQDLPWHKIWSADNPVEIFNEHLSLLVGCYVITRSSIYKTRLSLGLMINACVLLLIFGGTVIALGFNGKSLSAAKWELMKPIGPSICLV